MKKQISQADYVHNILTKNIPQFTLKIFFGSNCVKLQQSPSETLLYHLKKNMNSNRNTKDLK